MHKRKFSLVNVQGHTRHIADPSDLRDRRCPVAAGGAVPTYMTGASEPAARGDPADAGRLAPCPGCSQERRFWVQSGREWHA